MTIKFSSAFHHDGFDHKHEANEEVTVGDLEAATIDRVASETLAKFVEKCPIIPKNPNEICYFTILLAPPRHSRPLIGLIFLL
ncbi:hypothetical protein ACROYT_G000289 [Oculina patagonica]